jgi:[phosphatase 2A protein]-leucine-carboxy methyltransferase
MLYPARGGTALHSPVYHLLPADLRLPPQGTLSALLSSPVSDPIDSSPSKSRPLISTTLPTLLLFECVLVYMSPSASSALIQWFVDYFSGSSSSAGTSSNDGCAILGGIVYEMFGLGDAFGRVMLNNLRVPSDFLKNYVGTDHFVA